MPCAMPLFCLLWIFSFAAIQLAHFPTSSATCSMVPCLVNCWFIIILTILSLLCLNTISPLTIMNFELTSNCGQQQHVIMWANDANDAWMDVVVGCVYFKLWLPTVYTLVALLSSGCLILKDHAAYKDRLAWLQQPSGWSVMSKAMHKVKEGLKIFRSSRSHSKVFPKSATGY